MARIFTLWLGVAWLLLGQLARADELRTARGQPLTEESHRVLVSIKDGVTKYRVRRTFHNQGTSAEEARLRIDLPHGAVATGLRIFAGGKWHDGDLMHRDKAEDLYRELTGLGPSRPKDPALLYWTWTSELGLRVFPIFPKSRSLVEYTLTVPTHYEGGQYFVSYPRQHEDSPLATPLITVDTGRVTSVDGVASKSRVVRLKPATIHPVIEQLGRTDARTLVRTLNFPHTSNTDAMAIDVNIEHTWAGDLHLEVVDPTGQVHQLKDHDLSQEKNDLSERFVVDYPGEKRGTWHLLVTDYHPLDGGRLLKWSLTPVKQEASPQANQWKQTSLSVTDRSAAAIPQPNPSQGDVATIALTSPNHDTTSVRFGRVEFRDVPRFARVEIDVAKRLSELPQKLRATFVLDLSHTMGRAGIEAQLRLAKAYLSHVPRAHFALVGVTRKASVLSTFEKASNFDAVVSKLQHEEKLRPQNGSFLDLGLAKAAELHSLRPGQGRDESTAVIAFTDDRLRPVWETALALPSVQKLPEKTVVHVVDLSLYGDVEILRNDDHRLYPLARTRGGVAVTSIGALRAKWSRLSEEVLYLVRPNRLDHVKPSALKVELQDFGPSLKEGEGVRWMGPVASLPRDLSLTGQLWSRKVKYTQQTTEDFHRATAGFVFSLDHYQELTELQQFVVATYAQAVSPVTSYLAIEPGVRPSTLGLERTTSGFGSGWGVGLSKMGMGGHSSTPKIEWQKIQEKVARACQTHRKEKDTLHLTIDTNDHEIADVRSKKPLDRFGACVAEEIWKEQLPLGVRGDRSRNFKL